MKKIMIILAVLCSGPAFASQGVLTISKCTKVKNGKNKCVIHKTRYNRSCSLETTTFSSGLSGRSSEFKIKLSIPALKMKNKVFKSYILYYAASNYIDGVIKQGAWNPKTVGEWSGESTARKANNKFRVKLKDVYYYKNLESKTYTEYHCGR